MGTRNWLAVSAGILAISLCAAASADDHQLGKIRVCRIGHDSSGGNVYLPGDGTYSGDCDANGQNCRKILVGVMSSATLKAGQACAVLDAVLLQGDGQPLTEGSTLIARWDTGDFESVVKVAKTFK